MVERETIIAQPLTSAAFAAFGDVLVVSGTADRLINAGLCERYHDLAKLDFVDGRAGISLFDAQPRSLPCHLDLMERHPLGSQAFIPMTPAGFLITVADDAAGRPGRPRAFVSAPYQAINVHCGVWHGVLTPLENPGIFAVVDRIGVGDNLEEYRFRTPYRIM